jgi:Ala-tRNA(Pro) deacylase
MQVIRINMEMGVLYVHTVLCCNRHAQPQWLRQAASRAAKLVSSARLAATAGGGFIRRAIHPTLTLHPTSGGHVALYSLLDQLAIPYQRIDHAPVFTCEEASRLLPKLPAAKTKNLFLRDPKSERLFLVVAPEESRVDLKALAAALGVKRLSFGSPERLESVLGLTPGAVTLLAMVRDREKAVELVVDETIWQAERVQCHPLVNTATLLIRLDDVRRLLAHLGREATVMRLPIVSD